MFGDLDSTPKYKTTNFGKIATFVGGGTPSKEHPEYFGGEIPWISTPCLGKYFIDKNDAKDFLTEDGLKNSSTHLIPSRSIMIGTRVGVGKCSINLCPMCTNQDIVSLTKIDPASFDLLFVKYCVEMITSHLKGIQHGSTIQGVTISDIKKAKIALVHW